MSVSRLTGYSAASSPGGLPILILTTAFLLISWFGIALQSNAVLQDLERTSAMIRLFHNRPEVLLIGGFVGAALVNVLACWLLIRKPMAYCAVWIFAMSVAEAQIPILQPVSFLLRYVMMLPLIAVGVLALLSQKRNVAWDVIQVIALALLAIVIVAVLRNSEVLTSWLAVPMQITMYLGILFGLAKVVRGSPDCAQRLCTLLAVIGIAATVLNTFGLALADQPFLGGRFRSWYPLPTNFANNFVLLLLPVVWLVIETVDRRVKSVAAATLVVGVVLIVLSGTRNALVVLGIGLIVLTLLRKKKYLAIFGVVGVVAVLFAVAGGFGAAELGVAGKRLTDSSSADIRFAIWSGAWSYIKVHWVSGYGLDPNILIYSGDEGRYLILNTHNAYLGVWLRLGVLGLVAVVGMYVTGLYKGYRLILSGPARGRDMGALVLFVCMLTSLFVAGVVEDNLGSRAGIHQALWALSLMVIVSHWQRAVIPRRAMRIRRSIYVSEASGRPL